MFARMDNSTESKYTYYRLCGQLQGIHKTSVKSSNIFLKSVIMGKFKKQTGMNTMKVFIPVKGTEYFLNQL